MSAVRSAHASARAAFTSFAVDEERFVAHVARVLGDDVSELHPADLYLALGVLAGAPGAVTAMRDLIDRAAAHAARSMRLQEALQGDLGSELYAKLLIPGEKNPLAGYAGRGPLGAFLKVIALRQGAALLAEQKGELPASDVEELAGAAVKAADAEGLMVTTQASAAVKAAFQDAIRRLSGRDRLLLRLQLLHGKSQDEIAQTMGSSRATVGRWLEAARQAMWADARRAIAASLGHSETDIDDLVEELGSRLELSLSRLL